MYILEEDCSIEEIKTFPFDQKYDSTITMYNQERITKKSK